MEKTTIILSGAHEESGNSWERARPRVPLAAPRRGP